MRDGIPLLAPEAASLGEGFNPEIFAALAAIEPGHFWFEARNDLIVQTLRRFAGNPRRLLEIGCGSGFVLQRLAGEFPELETTGSELFQEGLAIARRRLPEAELLQLDARAIPFVDHFDVIGAFDVLEHINDDAAVLAQVHKALRPGGLALVSVPQHTWLWSRQDELACHVRRYSAAVLDGRLRDAGLTPLWRTSFVTLLLPLMLASRLAPGQRVTDDALAGVRVPAPLNRPFAALMGVERRLIGLGLRLPLGGSLLAVAQRR